MTPTMNQSTMLQIQNSVQQKETLISIVSIRDIRNAKDSWFLKQELYK
jgi:hypothetical protein